MLEHNISCQLSTKLTGGSNWDEHPLTSAQKKAAEILRLELDELKRKVALKRILVVTLTFREPLPDIKTMFSNMAKIARSFFRKEFLYGVTIFDRSETGRPHFHVIAVGDEQADFRTGFDFLAWHASRNTGDLDIDQLETSKSKYVASASPELRFIWAKLRKAATKYGFGRTHALPVEDPIAFTYYFAKCVTRTYRLHHPDDRGRRRTYFWGNFPRSVNRSFTRLTKGATQWRGSLAFCAHVLEFEDYSEFQKCFGSQWFIF